ncbi:apolipoprotein D-like [Oppia nitens]|uniref:apolipoprotein D-like n=1 Tax=Oppia nitens TaxID=1686743 RepID=UPI0023D9DDB1|nr:apolipoprotein D-like [Oppia nitens]
MAKQLSKIMTNWYTTVILLSLSVSLVVSDCPEVKTVDNFDVNRYMGKWYEIMKYPMLWETGLKCVTQTLMANSNGTLSVKNAGVYKLIDYPVSITGLAISNYTDPAKLTVEFKPFPYYTSRSKLWILETDYSNYALAYSCINPPFVPFNIENAWILSRKPNLNPQIVELLRERLNSINSPSYLLYSTDQSNCPKTSNTDQNEP